MTSGNNSRTTVDWSAAAPARALHYVFKVGDRMKTMDFYRNILLMKVLRHEEFEEGCKATCNGPYQGAWSKSMVGYGPEDDHFVIELTYNYEIGSYKNGNDFVAMIIESDDVYKNVSENHSADSSGRLSVTDPDGHCFIVTKGNGSFITKVVLHVSDLNQSISYWQGILRMRMVEKTEEKAILAFGENQCKLELQQIHGENINRGTAFGRIAFAYPGSKLKDVEQTIKTKGYNVIKDLVTLQTPGKADVQVVILADPNGQEICFVGDEGFRELSVVDANAESLLNEAMQNDDSARWFPDGKRQG